VIAYASRTGTRRNLKALREAGWRIMVSAKGVLRTEGFPYCLDNGAWWAFVNGQPFDEVAFLRAYEMLAAGADFVVLPDVVAGGLPSLDFSLSWRERLGKPVCPQLLAVQDGMEPHDVTAIVGPHLGIFVGGSTEWKEARVSDWGELARKVSAYMHVGRANSARRIALCAAAGADSFDGSSASRYAVTLPKLDLARRQLELLTWAPS
jgi:hypothetical protein